MGGIGLLSAALAELGFVARFSGAPRPGLTTEGIFRFSRHPQVLGLILTMSGVALTGRSGLALALTGAPAVGLLVAMPLQERRLERAFGDPCRRYRAKPRSCWADRGGEKRLPRPSGNPVRRAPGLRHHL